LDKKVPLHASMDALTAMPSYPEVFEHRRPCHSDDSADRILSPQQGTSLQRSDI
jgi:hypothetical protein